MTRTPRSAAISRVSSVEFESTTMISSVHPSERIARAMFLPSLWVMIVAEICVALALAVLRGLGFTEAAERFEKTDLQPIWEAFDRMDHQWLNEFPPFDALNPSAENMAKYIYDEVSEGLKTRQGVRVGAIRLWETDTASATYRP